jgi:hypothetical protein
MHSRILPPAIDDDNYPAAMHFVETRMLNLRETQNAIIAAKTEQAHSADKTRKDPTVNPIKAGDYYVVCFSEWAGSKDDKAAKKLRQR